MKKNTEAPKKKSLDTFFGKPYIVIFAILLFACAALKLSFTLSRETAAGVWKFVLIFDTITTLLTSSSLFLFYMSSDTKTKEGTKISAITFLVTSVLSLFTQIVSLIYIATLLEFTVFFLALLFFFLQSIFQLRFAIGLTFDVFKKKPRAKGALEYAAAKVFTIAGALIIKLVDSNLLKLNTFKTPFETSNALQTNYPELAFYAIIISSLTIAAFAILYNKFACNYNDEKAEESK